MSKRKYAFVAAFIVAVVGMCVGQALRHTEPRLKTQTQRVSYGMGVAMARSFHRQSIDIDVDALRAGMRDELAGHELALTEGELQETMQAFRGELKEKHDVAVDERKRDEAKYLSANGNRSAVTTLPSGVQYEVLREGNGNIPTRSDSISCQYRLSLLDGTEIDSSYKKGRPAVFAVTNVIEGWQQVLTRMPVGSRWRVVVPSALAYGARGSATIPPWSTLVFDLDLVGIVK